MRDRDAPKHQLMRSARRQDGFTLIELLVVILVIGILAAAALPSFLSQSDKGKDSETTQLLTLAYKHLHSQWRATDSSQLPPTSNPADPQNTFAAMVGRIAASEPDLPIAVASSFLEAPQISVSRNSNTAVTLRAQSRSGEQFSITAQADGPALRATRRPDGTAPNLAPNGGFESATTDWSVVNGSGMPGTLTADSAWRTQGAQSGRLRATRSTSGPDAATTASSGLISVTGGAPYTARVKVNIAENPRYVNTSVEYYDASGTRLSHAFGPTTTGTGEREIVLALSAPSAAATARINIRGVLADAGTSFDFRFDDVTFARTRGW